MRGTPYVALGLVVALLACDGDEKRAKRRTVNAELNAIQAAVKRRRDVALGDCPSVEKLRAAHEVDAGAKDPWGATYGVRCSATDTTVTSFGPDGKEATADDIIVVTPWTPPEPTAVASSVAPTAPDLPPPNVPALEKGIVMSLSVVGAEALAPVLVLETNLPDGTSVIFDLADEEWFTGDPEKPNKGYVAQSKTLVRGGRARSEVFGYRGKRFPHGKYQGSVLMPDIGVQDESVRAVLGKKGERMRGPLVKHDKKLDLVTAEKLIRFTM